MNKEDRKKIERAESLLCEARMIISELSEEVQEKADNMEEYFPDSEKTERLQEEASNLEELYQEIEDNEIKAAQIREGEF